MRARDTLVMDDRSTLDHVMRGAAAHDINAHEINLVQLDPPVPLRTPDGDGIALILSDEGGELGLRWTVMLSATGAIRTYPDATIQAAASMPRAFARAA